MSHLHLQLLASIACSMRLQQSLKLCKAFRELEVIWQMDRPWHRQDCIDKIDKGWDIICLTTCSFSDLDFDSRHGDSAAERARAVDVSRVLEMLDELALSMGPLTRRSKIILSISNKQDGNETLFEATHPF